MLDLDDKEDSKTKENEEKKMESEQKDSGPKNRVSFDDDDDEEDHINTDSNFLQSSKLEEAVDKDSSSVNQSSPVKVKPDV